MRRALAAALVLGALACARRVPLTEPDAKAFHAVGPDSFDVRVVTTKGTMRVRVRRDWSPAGADRFHALVRQRFFDDVAFHRTIRNYVAQFGIPGDPDVTRAWRGQSIPDEPVRAPNRRGALSFARGGPNSRTTQLFFNLVDNTPRLDTLGGGYPPIGEVVEGLVVLDSLYWQYSGTRGGQTFPDPPQDSISRQGNAFLRRAFPRLDYIVTARVVKHWK